MQAPPLLTNEIFGKFLNLCVPVSLFAKRDDNGLPRTASVTDACGWLYKVLSITIWHMAISHR